MGTTGAVLGLPGAPLASCGAVAASATKAGGVADWLGDIASSAAARASRCCTACGAPRLLALQAAAPAAWANERTIYVWACAKGCAAKGAWEATLAERRLPEAQAGVAAVGADGADGADGGAGGGSAAGEIATQDEWVGASDDWGAEDAPQGDDAWDAGDGFAGVDSDAASRSAGAGCGESLEELAAAMERVAILQRDTAAQAPLQQQQQQQQQYGGTRATPDDGASQQQQQQQQSPADGGEDGDEPHLPAFLLSAEWEPQVDAAAEAAERHHAKKLLEGYEAAEGSVQDEGGAGGGAGGAGTSSAGRAEEKFESEQYEANPSLDWGGGSAGKFLKFQKRLARAPTQCARYYPPGCVATAVAWPCKKPPAAAKRRCEHCGGALRAECQLMPPLLYYLTAGLCEWHDDGDDAPPSGRCEAQWEWLTAIVFTCAKGCNGGELSAGGVTTSACIVEVIGEEKLDCVVHGPRGGANDET